MRKFGTFSGVFVPSFEAILGAVLFLILPYLTAGVGLLRMLLIVVLANTATLATSFSIADCATNLNQIGGGGMYAVSKRSLGVAFGGSIGVQLFLAQAISIGFYCIGFAEAVHGAIARLPSVARFLDTVFGGDPLVPKQAIATLFAAVGFVAALVGADFVSKIQTAIFVVLGVSVVAILAAPAIPGSDLVQGGAATTVDIPMIGFWAAFATFFPAVTGIDAGVGMSGVLKDPRRSIPRGTFLAIGVTLVVYVAVTYVYSLVPADRFAVSGGSPPTAVDLFGAVPWLASVLLVGILVATGSSALSYFMTSPRTLQALAVDGLLPRALSFFAGRSGNRSKVADGVVPEGEAGEPRAATVVTFAIVLAIIWAGDITFASLVVGIAFLSVYGWVNVAAFLERASGNPSFRPTSRGHWAISLYGFVICMAVIAQFNVWVGIGLLAAQMLMFWLLLRYRSNGRLEGVWWGAQFRIATRGLTRLGTIEQGSKNWRPIVGAFAFSDDEAGRAATFEIAGRIGRFKGLLMYNVLRVARRTPPDERNEVASEDVPTRHQVHIESEREYDSTIRAISQAVLPAGLAMNTVVFPYDTRLDITELTFFLHGRGKNVLLFRNGIAGSEVDGRIDVWWKGEKNGNLMALLAYMIATSDREAGLPRRSVRLLRKLTTTEDPESARRDMEELATAARLDAEVDCIAGDDRPFLQTVRVRSAGATLVLMGLPGEPVGPLRRLFHADERRLRNTVESMDGLPPILFVKAFERVELEA